MTWPPRYRIAAFVAVACGVRLASPAAGDTFISGDLPSVLTLANSPYIALADLAIPVGQTTTIEPGVVVYFTANTELWIARNGELRALGGSASAIQLLGWDSAPWDGIRVEFSSSNTFTVLFNWVELRDADRAIYMDWGASFSIQIDIRNSTFDVTQGRSGITAREGGSSSISTVYLENVNVFGGSERGVDVGLGAEDQVTVVDCHVTGCQTDGIRVSAASAQCSGITVDSNQTGLSLFGTGASCSGLLAENNGTGLVVGTGATVVDSEIYGNQTGVSVTGSNPPDFTVVTGTTITGNTNYGVSASDYTEFSDCEIHGNGLFDVRSTAPILDHPTISFQGCYWGEITTAEMLAEGTFSDIEAISDWWDDSSKSLVDFEGFITAVPVAESVQVGSWGSIKARYRE